jgi:hypothetical protein
MMTLVAEAQRIMGMQRIDISEGGDQVFILE